MNVYTNFDAIEMRPSAVALGMFDGVHLGHQKVIKEAFHHGQGLRRTVLTFTTKRKRPRKKAQQRDILTVRGRIDQLEMLGVEAVFIPDFEQIQAMSPEEFVNDILKNKLHAKIVCCGNDFRFGKYAFGNVHDLEKLCVQVGIGVVVVKPVLEDNIPISSTRIRACLQAGDLPTANCLLGYDYFIEGAVIYGKQLGRTIQCPTINQELPEEICIPKFGVYISTTRIDGMDYPSITNIGKKPTISGERLPLAETHIIGIDRQLYGETLRVTLYKFIRGEEKFDNLTELSLYIHRDIQAARDYFG